MNGVSQQGFMPGETAGIPNSLYRKRKSPIEAALERIGMQNNRMTGVTVEPPEGAPTFRADLPPLLPDTELPLRRSPLSPQPMDEIPRPSLSDELNRPMMPTRRQTLEEQVAALNRPPTRRQALIQGLVQGGTVGLGGLFGGLEGASGAAEGVTAYNQNQQNLRLAEKKSLLEEISKERKYEVDAAENRLQRELESQRYKDLNSQFDITQTGLERRHRETLANQLNIANKPDYSFEGGAQGQPYGPFNKRTGEFKELGREPILPKEDLSLTDTELFMKDPVAYQKLLRLKAQYGASGGPTDFDKRLNLFRTDPNTFRLLFGRDGREAGPLDLAAITQRMITASKDPLGNIDPQTYERQRAMLSRTLGVELPRYSEIQSGVSLPETGSGSGSVLGGLGSLVNPQPGLPRPGSGKYSIGQAISGSDGQMYRITGFDPIDGHPLGEPINPASKGQTPQAQRALRR